MPSAESVPLRCAADGRSQVSEQQTSLSPLKSWNKLCHRTVSRVSDYSGFEMFMVSIRETAWGEKLGLWQLRLALRVVMRTRKSESIKEHIFLRLAGVLCPAP
ncbi:hypothetical protein AMECASPLE_003841 [Ameca splendens]|uniref:Uncharacterized protein n=1 Tax=Ameca splendens TaxID=208324 RepID=A0ABV1A5E3_9TELE